jgi:lipoic acid synthetase
MTTPLHTLPIVTAGTPGRRLPPWLKRPMPVAESLLRTRQLVNGLRLNTVCVEAHCPNLTECWSRGTATFMILGDRCTRRCHFCAVHTQKPLPPEPDEPERLAEAVAHLKLHHVVITSVARDDLPDEGSGQFAACIRRTKERLPDTTIEVLVPDFHARPDLIGAVIAAEPEVFNHNLETVASQQKRVRPAARYQRSLDVLRIAKAQAPQRLTKSGLMVGLGETRDELLTALRDLRSVGCDLLTLGQYLRPSDQHAPVERYYPPQEFADLADAAKEFGFLGVASGPFVRSSYFAESLFAETDFFRRPHGPGRTPDRVAP